MTSHTRFPAIDPDALTTFSERMISDLARGRLGFDGVITSDAFGMKGLVNFFDPEFAAVKVFQAGADTILKRHGRKANFSNVAALRNALEIGEINEARIDESVRRIFALKGSYCVPDTQHDIEDALWNRKHINLLEELGKNSVTLVKNEDHLLPLKLENREKVLLVMPDMLANASLDGTTGDMAGYIIRGLLSESYAYDVDGFDLVHYGLNPYREEVASILERARDYDILILGGHRANVRERQAGMIQQLYALDKPTIFVALNSPYDLQIYPEATTHICTFGERLPQLKALCGIISGQITPAGRLPVNIADLQQFGDGITTWD